MPLSLSPFFRNLRRAAPSGTNLAMVLLLGAAAISIRAGLTNAMLRSQDFQWSGERLLLQHIDPWAEYLKGDPNHHFLLTQVPNYLPVLYLVIVPLGLLSLFHAKILWAALNLCFAVSSGFLAARSYDLRGRAAILVVCLLLIATPTRTALGNGQQSLFVLVLWCAALLRLRLSASHSVLAGISYAKFNFAPPILLYLWLRQGWRAIVWSALPSVVATILVWVWINGFNGVRSLVRLVVEPVAVSRTGYFPSSGGPNLMDVLEQGLDTLHAPESVIKPVTLLAAVAVCFIVLALAVRRHGGGSVQWQMALLGTMSFALFKHHQYDAVVLLFPLCHALRLAGSRIAQAILLLLGYLWYLQRLVDPHNDRFVFQFLLLVALLLLTYRLRSFEEGLLPEWIASARNESSSATAAQAPRPSPDAPASLRKP